MNTRIIQLMTLIVAMLFAASCSKDSIEIDENDDASVPFSLTVSQSRGLSKVHVLEWDDTKVQIGFEAGDEIIIHAVTTEYPNGSFDHKQIGKLKLYEEGISEDGKTATFVGKLSPGSINLNTVELYAEKLQKDKSDPKAYASLSDAIDNATYMRSDWFSYDANGVTGVEMNNYLMGYLEILTDKTSVAMDIWSGSTTSYKFNVTNGALYLAVSEGSKITSYDLALVREEVEGGKVYTIDRRYADYVYLAGAWWAKSNLAATNPEDPGNVYSWGEVEVKSGPFDWSTYKFCDPETQEFSKYTKPNEVLELEDDAAYVNKMHNRWRIPTVAEWGDLKRNCTWKWTTLNGVNGYKVSDPNDATKYIFLPAAGAYTEEGLQYRGTLGCYWTSSRSYGDVNKANDIYFDSNGIYTSDESYRCYGFSIRPVWNY